MRQSHVYRDGGELISDADIKRRALVERLACALRPHDLDMLGKYAPEDAMLRSILKVVVIVVVSAVIATAVLYIFPAALPVRPVY